MREPVHTVHDFYDGPRAGAVDYNGAPHWYERHFDIELDDWSEVYALVALPPEVMAAERQRDDLFASWQSEFKLGRVPLESHPRRTVRDREFMALSAVVDQFLEMATPRVRVRGRFVDDPESPSRYAVEWSAE